jgi:NitT/TauT family transport system ATP-binding protein
MDDVSPDSPNSPILVIDSVTVELGHPGSSHAAIGSGEFVTICGPSGTGKTTLLRAIAGLCDITQGQIRLADSLVTKTGRRVGYIVQDYSASLFPWLTAFRNVELATRALKLSRTERRHVVEEAFELVGLTRIARKYPWELSGGMQQRVAIARALAAGADLLLMDEPFASIDAHTRFELEDIVRSIVTSRGTATIMVTHDIDEAVYMSNRVLAMNGSPGKIVSEYVVTFTDPRDQIEVRSDPQFVAIRNALYRDLQPVGDRGSSRSIIAGELIGFLRKQKCQFVGGQEETEKFIAGLADIPLSRVIIDSLAAMELCIWLEDCWGVEISSDKLFNFASLGQLVNKIH